MYNPTLSLFILALENKGLLEMEMIILKEKKLMMDIVLIKEVFFKIVYKIFKIL